MYQGIVCLHVLCWKKTQPGWAANKLYELYAGHRNVFYIGDRQRLPNQLNGKSANLNHVMTQKIYPGITSWEDIPEKDVIMVVDCDHMCKPELFDKMGPCMRDTAVAVTLVPQWFHNLVHPGPCLPSSPHLIVLCLCSCHGE
jgi:hypothetical protein